MDRQPTAIIRAHVIEPAWVDTNVVVSVAQGDWAIESELLRMKAQGRQLLITPTAHQELTRGNMLRPGKEYSITPQQRVAVQGVLGRLGIQVDTSAAKYTVTERFAFKEQAQPPKSPALKNDHLIVGEVLASAKARGVSKPLLFSCDTAMRNNAARLGIQVVNRSTPSPQFLQQPYTPTPIYRTRLTIPISVQTSNRLVGRILGNQGAVAAAFDILHSQQVKWKWDEIEERVAEQIREHHAPEIAEAYARGEGVLLVIRAQIANHMFVPLPEFVGVRVLPGKSPEDALEQDGKTAQVTIGVDSRVYTEVVRYRWLGDMPVARDPIMEMLLERSPGYQKMMQEVEAEIQRLKAEEEPGSPAPAQPSTPPQAPGSKPRPNAPPQPTLELRKSFRW